MATYTARTGDATPLEVEFEANGAGTVGDPFRNVADINSVSLPASIYHGQTTVTTAGTSVDLAASQAITVGVTIKALAGNTGIMYVADGTGDLSSIGFELSAKEQVFLAIDNLNTVQIDASQNGEGVCYIAT